MGQRNPILREVAKIKSPKNLIGSETNPEALADFLSSIGLPDIEMTLISE